MRNDAVKMLEWKEAHLRLPFPYKVVLKVWTPGESSLGSCWKGQFSRCKTDLLSLKLWGETSNLCFNKPLPAPTACGLRYTLRSENHSPTGACDVKAQLRYQEAGQESG